MNAMCHRQMQGIQDSERYQPNRATVHFQPELHKAIRLKAHGKL